MVDSDFMASIYPNAVAAVDFQRIEKSGGLGDGRVVHFPFCVETIGARIVG